MNKVGVEVVSRLLALQSAQIEDVNIKEPMLEGQNRVQSINAAGIDRHRTSHQYADVCFRTRPRRLVQIKLEKVQTFIWKSPIMGGKIQGNQWDRISNTTHHITDTTAKWDNARGE